MPSREAEWCLLCGALLWQRGPLEWEARRLGGLVRSAGQGSVAEVCPGHDDEYQGDHGGPETRQVDRPRADEHRPVGAVASSDHDALLQAGGLGRVPKDTGKVGVNRFYPETHS